MSAGAGLVIAAPQSGSGKTVLTLGLLRALARRGLDVVSAKAGPDYIDPKFHEAASGAPCVNLDAWGMRESLLCAMAHDQARSRDLLVVEGVMGLYDAAADGTGSTADLAARLGLPVVLVVDAGKQAQSVAALVRGFRDHGPADVAGVILNRVGSQRHEAMLRAALRAIGMPVLGALRRDAVLALPERHLGLVQAGEQRDLHTFLDVAGDQVAASVDLDAVTRLARPLSTPQPCPRTAPLAPLAQRMAVARDEAFAFAYPHLLDGWHRQGVELNFFSPLADEPPPGHAQAVYLPGGYPELHAGRLAAAGQFLGGLRAAAGRGVRIYGECGGYMVLGETLIDRQGEPHRMAGLLPLVSSFEKPRLHLGYRRLRPLQGAPWEHDLTAHEFHYASTVSEKGAAPLFAASDAQGTDCPPLGLVQATVMGSFAHVIDAV